MRCMPIIIAAWIYLYFVLKGDRECSKKRKGISFSFVSPSFSLFHLNPSLKRQRNLFFYLFRVLDPTRELFNWTCTVFSVVTKMKGIYKGFNNFFSQIFVVKEREIEIGYPTDVKHVAHIGWDGSSGSTAPTWMNEFKTGPEFTTSSIGNNGSALSPWSSQDYGEESMGQSTSGLCRDIPSDLPNVPKPKQKRRKTKPNTSPRSNSSSTSKTARAAKSKAKLVEGNAEPASIEVARIGVQNSGNIEVA